MKKIGLFFDLDGTLWNSLPQITKAWNKAMVENNINRYFTEKDISSYMGLTPEETAPLAFPFVDFKRGLELFKLCFEYELKYLMHHPGVLFPKEKEILQQLSKEFPLYVLSNADVGYIDTYIEGYGLKKIFKSFLCAGDTHLDKADNIKLLKSKEKLDHVIYIGDTKKDMEQTLIAGETFVFASYGFGNITDNNVYKIKSIEELPKVIEVIKKSLF